LKEGLRINFPFVEGFIQLVEPLADLHFLMALVVQGYSSCQDCHPSVDFLS
jgi:hypothetical protein